MLELVGQIKKFWCYNKIMKNSPKKTILIVGGGWAGIQTAFALSDFLDRFEVILVEKEKSIGGIANSEVSKQCVVEYSWRVYFDQYYLVRRILESAGVASELCPLQKTLMVEKKSGNPSFQKLARMTPRALMDYFDWPVGRRLKFLFLYYLPDPLLYSMYKNTIAFDYFDKNPFIGALIGPVLGLEITKASLYTFISLARGSKLRVNQYHVSCHAPHRYMFPAIHKMLKKRGVKILTGCEVTSIERGRVETKQGVFEGDEIVLACTRGMKPILGGCRGFSGIRARLGILEKTGCQFYLSMNFYFSEPLGPPQNYILVNQPWNPIIETKRTQEWKQDIRTMCTKSIQEVWNVGVSDFIMGKNNKILRECTLEEAIQETILQVSKDPCVASLRTKSGKNFTQVFLGAEAHSYWTTDDNKKINKKNKKTLHTRYPKFSPNAWSLDSMLSTSYPELAGFYFCGYYNEPTGRYGMSMETSSYSGVLAGQEILHKYDLELSGEILSCLKKY